MRLGVLMDSLNRIKASTDTSVAMLKRAEAMGWECYYFTQNDLYVESGIAFARVFRITIGDENSTNWASVISAGVQALSTFDILLMRKDPPFDMQYIYTTYVLDLAEAAGVLVANKPQSLRDANEKFFTQYFPQCLPPSLVSQTITDLRAFWDKHRRVIFKPLSGMGGRSVFYVDEEGANISVILDTLTCAETVSIMAQAYIPDITQTGDKRVLLMNGDPVPFGLARIPANGEIRGNLAAGGKGKVVPLSARDYWICEQIAPTLRAKGLYFVGIDIIGDYLTEINVTSPTCIVEISRETGLDIAGDYLKCLTTLRG